MKTHSLIHVLALAVCTLYGCAQAPAPNKGTMRCQHPIDPGVVFGAYSFENGEMTGEDDKNARADVVIYFDGDDCAQGILLASGKDGPGYVFPIGHKTWSALVTLEPPSADSESVPGINPLTKDKEGYAFWAKAADGEFTLVKITKVEPATYDDLTAGTFPTLEFEWYRP